MLIIAKSITALGQAQRLASEQDSVLLVESAVYAAISQHQAFSYLKGLNVSVLREDLQARGIEERVSPSLNKVDFDGFVQLTTLHIQSITLD
ncbi:sulfurtransferase complex subunit TusB [Vibrio agarivorans]|uniref:sulfurtransferase complex subunit TusB n=1 Tax=Vibrio agarivorans TaxID=153622 RepID=UPI00222F7F6C|nr:sulfurtransferase complex subunit TusB [Vibrio agarivorans]MDN3662311.1 sulfurtransferase complex subunit TusB [Vibrio agarivorans]